MDIRIDGLHEKAMLRLMERNGQKTSVGMARILIRDAALDAGVWNENDGKVIDLIEVQEAVEPQLA